MRPTVIEVALMRHGRELRDELRTFLLAQDPSIDEHALDDLCQEALLRLCQNGNRFRGESSVKTYLLGIGRNVLREATRKHHRTISDLDTIAQPDTRDLFSDPEAALHRKEIASAVQDGMNLLSAKERRAIESVCLTGVRGAQVARTERCSPVAIRARVYSARKKLRRHLRSFRT